MILLSFKYWLLDETKQWLLDSINLFILLAIADWLFAALKMKFLGFLLLSIIFAATSYAEASDESQSVADSPLISYLLGKIQRLEAKMAMPSVRNTRQVDIPNNNSSKNR